MDSPIDREPRKEVRVRLRPDLLISGQEHEGRKHYVVKDPISLRYFRFKEREHFLIQLLDGAHTFEDVQKEYEKRFPPARLSIEEMEAFAQELMTAGLANSGSSRAGGQLLERMRDQRRAKRWAAFSNVLAVQVPLFDPDRLLGRLLPLFGWVFTGWFLALSAGMIVGALFLVISHFDTFRAGLPAYHEFFTWQTIAYLWLALGAVKIVHEFGHALCCKAFGGEVHEMGLLFLCFSPCLYCDVSDAWILPGKWQRTMISMAGVYIELIMAAVASFLWWNTTGHPFVHNLCLCLMLVCGISTVVFNANPLMRYDGYFVLADWLEIPNLRERCNRYLLGLMLDCGLGIEVRRELYQAAGRGFFLAGYALASFVYRWAMTFSLLWLLSRFLKPYKLEAAGLLLTAGAGAVLLARRVYRFGQHLSRRSWRFPSMRLARFLVTSMLLGSTLGVFFLLPLPISHVREIGLVQVQPDAAEQVFVQAPGILQKLHARNGQHAEKGDLLAEFRSVELENLRADALAERDIHEVQLQGLREQAAVEPDSMERTRLEAVLARRIGQRPLWARRVEVNDKIVQRLTVRAPRAGVVMGLPPIDEVGRSWGCDPATPLCSIGDPGRLWVLLPLGPADFRLLRKDLEDARQRGADLAVAIRVQGRIGCGWSGTVVQLPESPAREIPILLAQRAGGPVAVNPASSSSDCVPQAQHYLVAVSLREPDPAIVPGTLAPVVIRCRWRTCAWRVWRTLSTYFDLGLM